MIDTVIVQQLAAFIQSNDDQIICMENSLHTNGDIIVNTAFKELNILPEVGPTYQNVSKTINNLDKFAEVYAE